MEKELAPDSPVWNYQTIAQGYHIRPRRRRGQIRIPTWKTSCISSITAACSPRRPITSATCARAPEWTLNAEKYASLAWLDGNAYPGEELTEAWKKITFNDFHDLAAGSGIGVIYKDAQKDYDQVRWATNEISAKALKTVAAHIDTHVAGGRAGAGLQSAGVAALGQR